MSSLKKKITILIIGLGLIFVGLISGALIGAFVGWLLQKTFISNYIVRGFEIFGFDVSNKLVEVGAMLGFIGAFFSSSGGSSSG